MNASKLADDLEKKTHLVSKNFNCSICMDFFQSPVITNCQHVFCRKCIEEYIGDKRYKDCPLCKNQINTRSLKNFEALNNLVSKAKDLSDAFNADKTNLKTKGILKENPTNTNKNAISSMLKRKRSLCNDEATDTFKRSRTSDTRLSVSSKHNVTINLKVNENESTTTRVKKWLNTVVDTNATTSEANKENEHELDGNNNKACSKITITRLPKTKDLNNNNEKEKTVPNNFITTIEETQPTTSNNDDNNLDNHNKEAQLNEYYNITNIDNPIKFRKEDQEVTHNVTTKSKTTITTTTHVKENTTVVNETINLNDMFHNLEERPKRSIDKTKLIKFIQKGSLKPKTVIPIIEKENTKKLIKINSATNTDIKVLDQKLVQTELNTQFNDFNLIESILLNEVYNHLKEEALKEFINETNNNSQQNRIEPTLVLTNELTKQQDKETTKSKKKPLFRQSLSKHQTIDLIDANETKTVNETIVEPPSSALKATSKLVVEDTPTKNDEPNEKLNEINRTLSKSANRMELVDSRIYLKNLSLETSNFNNEEEEDEEQEETTNLEKTLILEEKNEITRKKSIEKVQNYSNVMNSMNLNDMTYMNMTNNNKELLKYPPPANDILGASYIRDSMSLMVTEEKQPTPKESLENKENTSKSASSSATNSLKDKETQLLTESQLNVIDNISKQNNSYFEKKIQNESFSVQKQKESHPIEFVCSLLKPDMKELLKKFSNHINAKIENDITDTTTHLIVDSDENLICGVTSKYLKAITRKVWIVSVLWLKACVNQKQLIDPSKFEIRGDTIFGVHMGPKTSRLSSSKLFSSYEFLFLGKFETEKIPLDDILILTELNGGRVVKRAKDFSNSSVRIVIFDQSKTVDAEVTNKMFREASLHSLTMSWLLDSLACYKLFDYEAYALYDT